MGLNDGRVGAAIAVSNMDLAVEFYEGKLGLRSTGGDDPDGGRTYQCDGGTTVHIFPSPLARASGATAAGWRVEDVESTIAGNSAIKNVRSPLDPAHADQVSKDGRSAMVVKSTWETPDAAREFFSAYARGLRYRFESATTEESSTNRQALTTPVAATDLRLQGSDVLTVIAFDRDTANAIVDAVTASAL